MKWLTKVYVGTRNINADFWRCLATALTLSIKLHESRLRVQMSATSRFGGDYQGESQHSDD